MKEQKISVNSQLPVMEKKTSFEHRYHLTKVARVAFHMNTGFLERLALKLVFLFQPVFPQNITLSSSVKGMSPVCRPNEGVGGEEEIAFNAKKLSWLA